MLREWRPVMSGRRRKPGRMGPFIEGYRAWLAGRGMPRARLSACWRWPVVWAAGWTPAVPGDLDRAAVTEFRDALRAAGGGGSGAHGLDRLLEYLEELGVLGRCSSPGTPVEVLAERYRRWLVTGRGLTGKTPGGRPHRPHWPLATPPPASHPPSPPALGCLRQDNTMITTNYSCRIRARRDVAAGRARAHPGPGSPRRTTEGRAGRPGKDRRRSPHSGHGWRERRDAA